MSNKRPPLTRHGPTGRHVAKSPFVCVVCLLGELVFSKRGREGPHAHACSEIMILSLTRGNKRRYFLQRETSYSGCHWSGSRLHTSTRRFFFAENSPKNIRIKLSVETCCFEIEQIQLQLYMSFIELHTRKPCTSAVWCMPIYTHA